MAIYFLNADADAARSSSIEQKLRAAIPDLIKIKDFEGALKDSRAARSDVRSTLLLLASTRDKPQLAELADIASRHRDHMFFVLISDEISASEYKSLVRAGGADWVSANAETQELLEIVSGARMRGRQDTVANGLIGGNPVAISLVPSAGGVGNSTLAIEIGIQLTASKSSRDLEICIVDLDFQSSHICDYLDIEPRLQMREILSNPERLDAQLFDIFISRHSSGLHVFSAPRSKIDVCDLNVAALDRLFDMISARYDLIIIDLPPTWFAWTAQIIAASDAVIVTAMNSIPGLRQAGETLSTVRAVARASSRIAIAVNRCERKLLGGIARRHHVESVLGHESLFYVANEPLALESINVGRPMVTLKASRGFARDIAALAAFCESVKRASVTPA